MLSINQSNEIPSGAARNNTKLFRSIGFDVAFKCPSLHLPTLCLFFSLSSTLSSVAESMGNLPRYLRRSKWFALKKMARATSGTHVGANRMRKINNYS